MLPHESEFLVKYGRNKLQAVILARIGTESQLLITDIEKFGIRYC